MTAGQYGTAYSAKNQNKSSKEFSQVFSQGRASF
jgi:hypothetical protein